MEDYPYIAHVRESLSNNESDVSYTIQTVEEHLRGTALLAGSFAKTFGYAKWGEWIGMMHDLGKLTNDFQNYIRICSGMTQAPRPPKSDHASAGAIYATRTVAGLYPPLAYCIAGHHSGLLDYNNSGEANLERRLQKTECFDRVDTSLIQSLPLPQAREFEMPQLTPISTNHWIRMLFSCLVDADYLDTERFMQPDRNALRCRYDSIAELKLRLDAHMALLAQQAPDTPLNRVRQEVLRQCREKAMEAPGLFSLTVPTGGGKTLASITWAIDHALANGKERIIVAIPYTSIISQTAAIFRTIFGEANVVEHHSNLRVEDEQSHSYASKLATENWDAPIVVTTNVQLFESLYAAKTSRCRKLHNLANAVLILDEAQMLPVEFLQPIVDSLKSLASLFKTSILFTTATQPVLTGRLGSGTAILNGFDTPVREIVGPDTDFSPCKRVSVEWPKSTEPVEFGDLAEQLAQHDQVICIVNTRREAQELFALMPEGTLHLSRMMCSAHIMQTIDIIKERLQRGEPVRVVSTQLIEAGVDIDFPIVYRAFAGLDSVVQAAGRCNREGRQPGLGRVVVFHSPHRIPSGLIRKGADTLRMLLQFNPAADPMDATTIRDYFGSFYARVNSFDKADIQSLLNRDYRSMRFQFTEAAEAFRLIDDRGTESIVVPYGEGIELIEQLKRQGPDRYLLRQLQQYSVSLPRRSFEELRQSGALTCYADVCILEYAQYYDDKAGLMVANQWLCEPLIV